MTEQQLGARPRIAATGTADTIWAIRMQRARTVSQNALHELLKSKTATVGAIMLVVLFTICLLTPILATHHPTKPNYRERLAPASAEHYFGTDKFGRDIYSRILYGGRRTVLISVVAVTFGLALGIPFGIFSGFFGGKFDAVTMRVADGIIAFPGLLLFLLIITLAREWKLEGVWYKASHDALVDGKVAPCGEACLSSQHPVTL